METKLRNSDHPAPEIRIKIDKTWYSNERGAYISYFMNGQEKYYLESALDFAAELKKQDVIQDYNRFLLVRKNGVTYKLIDFMERFMIGDWFKFIMTYEEKRQSKKPVMRIVPKIQQRA